MSYLAGYFGFLAFLFSINWTKLASQDRWDEVIKIFVMLHKSGDMDNPKVLAEYKKLRKPYDLSERKQILAFRYLQNLVCSEECYPMTSISLR